MGFGQSSREKSNDATIQQNTAKLGGIADSASTRGDKTFKFFKQSTKPALDFWSTLLSGDRTAINQLLGPEVGAISNNYNNAQRQLWNSPRGGGKVSATADLQNKEMEQMNNLFTSARPTAAHELTNLGSLFGNMSIGESGQGIGALGQSSNNLFNLNQEQERVRQAKAQMWASLGQGIGALGGAALGAPTAGGGSILGDKCCFIFLEATNGQLPLYVRELRDYYYIMEPAIARGYIRMASWLVPLMKRFKAVKNIINIVMVKPIIEYGLFLKTCNGYSLRNHFIKGLWFKVWKWLGSYE